MSEQIHHQEHEGEPGDLVHQEAVPVSTSPASETGLAKIASYFLLGLVFVLPWFVIPSVAVPLDTSKSIIVSLLSFSALILWLVSVFQSKRVFLPWTPVTGAAGILLVVSLLASFQSPSPALSLWGLGVEVNTFYAMALSVLILLASSSLFRNRERLLYLQFGLVFSFAMISLFHLPRLILGDASIFSFKVFDSPVFSLLGKWNDLASYSGLMLILVVIALRFFRKNNLVKGIASATVVLALLFLVSINFTVAWRLVALLLIPIIASFIHEVRRTPVEGAQGEAGARTPLTFQALPHLAIVLFVIASVFALGFADKPYRDGTHTLRGDIISKLGVPPYAEVSLTAPRTMEITKATLAENPLFGVGPNNFSSAYNQYRPEGANTSVLWDTPFEASFGRLPTFASELGAIGIVAWLFFIVMFILALRNIPALNRKGRIPGYLGFSTAAIALYSWGIALLYLPGMSMWLIAFLSTGAFLALLASEGLIPTRTFSFKTETHATPLVPVLLGASLVFVLFLSLVSFKSLRAAIFAQEARIAINGGDLEKGTTAITNAIALHPTDSYYQTLVYIYILKLDKLANENLTPDQLTTIVNPIINDAVATASSSVAYDPSNYQNYVAFGNIYEALALRGANAAGEARSMYAKALEHNPRSPRLLFAIARMELMLNDRASAKTHFADALKERPNYPDALGLYGQLEFAIGSPAAAVEAGMNGVRYESNNFVLQYILGYFAYSNEQYDVAGPALAAALNLNPTYDPARFFLSVSLARLGRGADAIGELQKLKATNTASPEVNLILDQIITNVKANIDPLTGVVLPPVLSPLEKGVK